MSFFDDFNSYGDGSLVTLSPYWTLVDGETWNFRVISGAVGQDDSFSVNASVHCPDQGSPNHVSRAVHHFAYSANGFAHCNRITNRDNFLGVRHDTNAWQVYKKVGGSFVGPLLSYTTPFVSGTETEFISNGNNHTLIVGGVYRGTIVGEAFNNTQTRQGAVSRVYVSGQWVDNFFADVLPTFDLRFQDEFTEASGLVALTSHTPTTTGVSWSALAGNAGSNAEIDATTGTVYQPYHAGTLEYNGYIANISGGWANDQRASRKLAVLSASLLAMVCVRLHADAVTGKSNGYGATHDGSTNNWGLYRLDSGVAVLLGQFFDDGEEVADVVDVEAIDGTIRMYINGILRMSVIDATYSTGSPGLALKRLGSITSGAADDFLGYDLGGAGGGGEVFPFASGISSIAGSTFVLSEAFNFNPGSDPIVGQVLSVGTGVVFNANGDIYFANPLALAEGIVFSQNIQEAIGRGFSIEESINFKPAGEITPSPFALSEGVSMALSENDTSYGLQFSMSESNSITFGVDSDVVTGLSFSLTQSESVGFNIADTFMSSSQFGIIEGDGVAFNRGSVVITSPAFVISESVVFSRGSVAPASPSFLISEGKTVSMSLGAVEYAGVSFTTLNPVSMQLGGMIPQGLSFSVVSGTSESFGVGLGVCQSFGFNVEEQINFARSGQFVTYSFNAVIGGLTPIEGDISYTIDSDGGSVQLYYNGDGEYFVIDSTTEV